MSFKSLIIQVDEELHSDIKYHCKAKGTSVKAYITNLVEADIKPKKVIYAIPLDDAVAKFNEIKESKPNASTGMLLLYYKFRYGNKTNANTMQQLKERVS